MWQCQETLKSMEDETDTLALAQANFYIGAAAVHCRSVNTAKRYLKRSIKIVRRNNIRFVPTPTDYNLTGPGMNSTASSAEHPEAVEERVTLLAQMVSMELMFYFLGQAYPMMKGIEVIKDEASEFPVRLCISVITFIDSFFYLDFLFGLVPA